jgi:hypothetical protein
LVLATPPSLLVLPVAPVSWRGQLMHVSVQRFTSTTTPQIGGAEWLDSEPLGRAAERGQMHTFEQGHL